MQARDVMTKAVVTIKPETPIGKIAALLVDKHISGVPVVDETGSVVGMVTEDDLYSRMLPTGKNAESGGFLCWPRAKLSARNSCQRSATIIGLHDRSCAPLS